MYSMCLKISSKGSSVGTSGITYIGFKEWGMQDEPHKENSLDRGQAGTLP